MSQTSYDVLIVGGGIMGSATAYNLLKCDPGLKVAVVERDSSYEKSSTTLSLANLRTVAFSLKENYLLSKQTFKILETFEEEMTVGDLKPKLYFRAEGNLFLTDADGLTEARAIFDMHRRLGSDALWLEPEDIKDRWPLINIDGIASGTFGPNDGHLDPYALLMAYKRKAKALGATYFEDEVITLFTEGKRLTGAVLVSSTKLCADITINCAGARAAEIAKTAGVDIPVIPVRRQVFALDTKVKPKHPLPLVFHPSGLYLRSETGGLLLVGKSLEEDPVGIDFNWERERFMEILWPELAEFIPAFDELKLVRGWAGLYAVNTLDHNAIIGPWPELQGFYLCNGFSGHGMMQGPAVGQYLAEVITGQPPTMDLSVFSPERILNNCPISESGCF
jgi:glycine/D-amino acid oxidase-like deaminating enzyme